MTTTPICLREVEKKCNAHRKWTSTLRCKIGDITKPSNKLKYTVASSKEALHDSPTNQNTMLSLARVQFLTKKNSLTFAATDVMLNETTRAKGMKTI